MPQAGFEKILLSRNLGVKNISFQCTSVMSWVACTARVGFGDRCTGEGRPVYTCNTGWDGKMCALLTRAH